MSQPPGLSVSTIAATVTTATGCHMLKFEGYNLLKKMHRNCKAVLSCTFEAAGYTWRIYFYPNSDSQYEPTTDYVSLFLMLDDDAAATSADIHPEFIKRGKLESRLSGFLKDDSFAIRCDITVLNKSAVKAPTVQASDLEKLGIVCDGTDDLCKGYHLRRPPPPTVKPFFKSSVPHPNFDDSSTRDGTVSPKSRAPRATQATAVAGTRAKKQSARTIGRASRQESNPAPEAHPYLEQEAPLTPSHQPVASEELSIRRSSTMSIIDKDSPLSEGLQRATYPPQFRMIPLAKFKGNSDPKQFLMSYEAAIISAGGDEVTLVKAFVYALEESAVNWYSTCLPGLCTVGKTSGIRWSQVFEDSTPLCNHRTSY
ncbi:hypothetical protein PR202_ga31453 [Eleusine coracana subsp. coracana]|uniref:MATH domain-containing protein n=1 Tax=Eleusine coracana subsp. coracana TaxID=191504 RepID=A0AAV5DRZ2_ELECO|nr:hypothetical protein PR202_ga31453 [Eleusine coracana subsp. coracana]